MTNPIQPRPWLLEGEYVDARHTVISDCEHSVKVLLSTNDGEAVVKAYEEGE